MDGLEGTLKPPLPWAGRPSAQAALCPSAAVSLSSPATCPVVTAGCGKGSCPVTQLGGLGEAMHKRKVIPLEER